MWIVFTQMCYLCYKSLDEILWWPVDLWRGKTGVGRRVWFLQRKIFCLFLPNTSMFIILCFHFVSSVIVFTFSLTYAPFRIKTLFQKSLKTFLLFFSCSFLSGSHLTPGLCYMWSKAICDYAIYNICTYIMLYVIQFNHRKLKTLINSLCCSDISLFVVVG